MRDRKPVGKTDIVPELTTRDVAELFRDARARHRAFDDHTTVWSVLAVLDDESDGRWPEKEALVRAIISEYQHRSHRFWSTVLLIAFWPMLQRIAREMRCGDDWQEDIDQETRRAFLEVAGAFPLERHRQRTAMFLRERTREKIRTWARRHRRRAFRVARHLDSDAFDAIDDLPDDSVRGDPATQVLARLIATVIAVHLDEETLELLAATALGGETLRDVVREQHPDGEPEAVDRAYQRTKMRYARAMRALRKFLTD